MTKFIPLFLVIILPVIIFALTMIIAYKGKHTDKLTIYEMKKCEKDICLDLEKDFEGFRVKDQKRNAHYLNTYALAEALKLKIIEDGNISEKNRGQLDEPDELEYNGTIKYRKDKDKIDKYAVNFDIIHEIMHYILDVGKGNKVAQSFPRFHHGYQRGHREQIIDYYAAAVAIPKDDLIALLRDKEISLCDDIYDNRVISELMDIYKQPRDTVIRRIKEVLVLQ